LTFCSTEALKEHAAFTFDLGFGGTESEKG
jgi:hypothetical protein